MTSILNNIAANTALLNLENTVKSLTDVQSQISTGLKIQSAADNAAYYSIASVLRTDSSALGTVSDTLNVASSSLGTATTALSTIQTTLSSIKDLLVNATTAGVDRTKIQQQIAQDQAQLANIANTANFNGQNFLSVNTLATNYNSTKSFVSSYSRDASGNVSVGFINLNTSDTALFDSGTGITNSETNDGLTSGTPAATTAGAVTYNAGVSTFTLTTVGANGNTYTNNFSVNGIENTAGTAPTIALTAGSDVTALGSGDRLGGVATGSASGTAAPTYDATAHTLTFYVAEASKTTQGSYSYQKVVISGIKQSSGSILDKIDTTTSGTYTDANGNTTTSHVGTGVSIFNMNISSLSDSAADMATLNAYQKQVDAAISAVTASASAIGAVSSRVTTQQSFVTSLQTSINNGVSSLVDADLNTASTRLQALQVQQQLGIQSLSIANSSTSAILKLFS